MNITMNTEKNGIEIRFDNKPEQLILDTLKANGFRWSKYQKMWYAKQTEERINLVNSLNSDNTTESDSEIKWNKVDFDLWDMTRINEIENHYANEKLHDTKEIAKRIRTHLRKRFPMCKWSVTSDYNSIDVKLKSAPWDKESDEVKAITEYAFRYTDSYNYDHSDSMTDYFDVNFYGTYSADSIIYWQFEVKEETVSEKRISETFREKKAAYEAAKKIREEEEWQKRLVEIEAEKKAYEEREKIRKANHEKVENNVVVKDVDEYFILNLKERSRKYDSVDSYMEDCGDERLDKWHRCDCKVSREITMSKETYELFSNQLMDDWSFLAGMGGYDTDDNRVNDMTDYHAMTEEERKTVKWYNTKCIAVFVDNNIEMVIDPEGYNYARYCFFLDKDTEINGEMVYNQLVSSEEKAINRKSAAIIEDVSASIIESNDMIKTWIDEKSDEYQKLMMDYFDNNNLKISKGIIREIKIPELKIQMYKLIQNYNGLQNQFRRCGLTEGDKFTLVKIDPWLGGLSVSHGTYHDYLPGNYAQYTDAVKLIFKPEKKRKLYYYWLYNDVIIYRGWLDLPENILWEVTEDKERGWTTKKSKYLSCDHQQYDAALDYFTSIGHKPIINTYN